MKTDKIHGQPLPMNRAVEIGRGNGGQRNEDQKTKSISMPDSSDPDSPDRFMKRFRGSKRESFVRRILTPSLSPSGGL